MNDFDDILIWSETVDDLERSRIALENRIRSMAERKTISLPLLNLEGQIKEQEKDAIKGLQKAVEAHPLGPWIKDIKGVGLKQAGRLLGVIGDPAARPNVAKLWAYCGYHVIDGLAPQREKGVQGGWNPKAKMRAFLIAEQCIKYKDSPYREVYDAARKKYAKATHVYECRRCGPKGKPAQPGSVLSLGHQHARSLRKVAKEILKDLWVESKRVQEPVHA